MFNIQPNKWTQVNGSVLLTVRNIADSGTNIKYMTNPQNIKQKINKIK